MSARPTHSTPTGRALPTQVTALVLALALLLGGFGRSVSMASGAGGGELSRITIAGITVSLCAQAGDDAGGRDRLHHDCDLCTWRLPATEAAGPGDGLLHRVAIRSQPPAPEARRADPPAHRVAAQPRGPPIA